MPSLTAKQIETLRLVAESRISGFRDKNGWHVFHQSCVICTAVVMALSAKGLVRIGQRGEILDVEMTERGRNVLTKECAPCR